MTLADVLQLTGEPGVIAALLALAWRVRKVELELGVDERRLANVEGRVFALSNQVLELKRLRERP